MSKRDLAKLVDEGFSDLLTEAKARFKSASDAEKDQREQSLADLRFCDTDKQWNDQDRTQREADGRPCLTIDRLNPFVHQIVNDQRQNRPQPQVNPVGDGADKDTAEVLQGMIRHIAYMSNGDTAIDTAFESMVRCGVGFFRVTTEYRDEKSFDQDIVIKRIPNAFMVYLDPSFTEPDGSDAEWGFIASYLSAEAYKAEYPKSQLAALDKGEWKSLGDQAPGWMNEGGAGCCVMEYFKKTRESVSLSLLSDGRSVKSSEVKDSDKVVDTRTAQITKVLWFKLNAVEVLDKTEWAGKYIPIVPVLGTELIIDGKRTWTGLIHSAKDAQMAYNYWKSAQAEMIALAPKVPWTGPKGFMGSSKAAWQMANRRAMAVLEYEAYDSQNRALAPPSRQAVEPPIAAITNAMVGSVDDLKATTGMYDPSLGNRSADQSGVAIRQLQRQGQSGNFHYQDNLARSVRHLGRILIDLIPKIYDTKRVVRIIKPDETTDLVTINGPEDGQIGKDGLPKIYDPSVGTYDVTVSVGPGYQTKRQENLALLESLMQGPLGKLLSTVAPDLIASELDFSIAPELVDRLKKTLPPNLQDPQPGQAQIPPQAQAQMAQQGQMIQQLTQALQQSNSIIASKRLELEAKERIAIIQAQAGILEAALKTGSQESIALLGHQMDALNMRWAQDEGNVPIGAPSQPQSDPSAPQQSPQQPSMQGSSGPLMPPQAPSVPYAPQPSLGAPSPAGV